MLPRKAFTQSTLDRTYLQLSGIRITLGMTQFTLKLSKFVDFIFNTGEKGPNLQILVFFFTNLAYNKA